MSVLSSFTKEERDACLPLISLLTDAANTARREGVLALEEWAEGRDFFTTYLFLLVVDGIMPDLVRKLGQTLIDADGHTGKELLSRMIILEGVLMVQSGYNPRIMEVKLLAMLGEGYLPGF